MWLREAQALREQAAKWPEIVRTCPHHPCQTKQSARCPHTRTHARHLLWGASGQRLCRPATSVRCTRFQSKGWTAGAGKRTSPPAGLVHRMDKLCLIHTSVQTIQSATSTRTSAANTYPQAHRHPPLWPAARRLRPRLHSRLLRARHPWGQGSARPAHLSSASGLAALVRPRTRNRRAFRGLLGHACKGMPG